MKTLLDHAHAFDQTLVPKFLFFLLCGNAEEGDLWAATIHILLSLVCLRVWHLSEEAAELRGGLLAIVVCFFALPVARVTMHISDQTPLSFCRPSGVAEQSAAALQVVFR